MRHWLLSSLGCFVCAMFLACPPISSAQTQPIKTLVLPGEAFLVEGRPAFILLPAEAKRQTPQPWIMYAPTLPGIPDAIEKWMHEHFLAAGVAVAGIDVGESYGSPEGRKLFTALYKELTEKRGFAPKPCLLCRSRGGLQATSWAADHPDMVAGIAGIYPVFDLPPAWTKPRRRMDSSPTNLRRNSRNTTRSSAQPFWQRPKFRSFSFTATRTRSCRWKTIPPSSLPAIGPKGRKIWRRSSSPRGRDMTAGKDFSAASR